MDDLLWELRQQRKIDRGHSAANRARSRAVQASRQAEDATEELDRLNLITHAMWELLAERLGLSQEDLVARMAQIDLRDGKQDGKLSRTGVSCQACNRVSHRRHQNCLYCGAALERKVF